MEEKIKRKVGLNFAGISLSLITDEDDAFVRTIEKKLDEEMTALLRSGRLSQIDAALLCAVEFCADKLTSEKKLRNLEAQVSLYEVNLRRLKNEVASLKKQLGDAAEVQAEAAEEIIPDEQMTIDENFPKEAEHATRSDKLRMIESLLKKN